MLNFTLPAPAAVAIAALVPMIMGFIWYNPKVFGTAWMNAAGLTPETAMKDFNMPLVMGISLLMSFMLAFSLVPMVLHQYGFFSMMMDKCGLDGLKDPNSDIAKNAQFMMANFGHTFHTFKHGALHGTILGIFTILPVIATGALFERKGWKYILINAGYWIVCLAIMGAIVCHFMPYPKLD